MLFKLNREIRLDPNILGLFHTLRIEGNRATHQFRTVHKEALDGLRLARTLAIWFHQAFGKPGAAFKPGPFEAPADPSHPLRELTTQIEQLKAKLLDASQQVESNKQLIALVTREKEEYAELAELMNTEARSFQQLAMAHEKQLKDERNAFDARLKAMQTELENRQQLPQQLSASIQKATAQLSLNEELTRILIDQQLISAGWEADAEQLIYQKDARPEKGKNKAIAEWPTQGNQAADYVLFAGLTPVEATFKWSRDNGAIVSGCSLSGTELTVDNPRGFTENGWAELTNDGQELRGKPGTLVWVEKLEDNVLTLSSEPTPKDIPYEVGTTWPTKARRWDHVKRTDLEFDDDSGTVLVKEGSIDIDTDWIELENGIRIQFVPLSDESSHQYRTGDYWLIPARVATGNIEWPIELTDAGQTRPLPQPPHGIHHHYAPLAILDTNTSGWSSPPTDLRCEFHPLKNSCKLSYSYGEEGIGGHLLCDSGES